MCFFNQPNLAPLDSEKRYEIIEKCRLVSKKTVEIFKYRKNNNKYWDKAKLYH